MPANDSSSPPGKKLTPAMQQYFRFKDQHPGCVLFFRMGDFYEMFYEDAELAHKVLGVTLTQRSKGQPMAGVPFHAVDGYLRRMIQAGYRVAVCDQVEDAAQAKGVVKRDVTRVITPGTLTDEHLLDEGETNPLAALILHDDERASIAWAELSTGLFQVATLPIDTVIDELARITPSELLYCQTATGEQPSNITALLESLEVSAVGRPAWTFRSNEALDILKRQYAVAQLTGFGFKDDDPALQPAGAILHYLIETQRVGEEQRDGRTPRLDHLHPPRRYERDNHLVIDQTSLASLEVLKTLRGNSTDGSLLGTLQQCVTAMGKRLLRQWLCYPLRTREAIEQRQKVVATLVADTRLRDELRDQLDDVQDIPRMAARLSVGRATPRDLVALGLSVAKIESLTQLLTNSEALKPYQDTLLELVPPLQQLAERITQACIESPPAHLRDGGLIADGYDQQLDEYRSLERDSQAWLANYQKELIEATDVQSLKVGYNKVFGYYIELSAANRDKALDQWTRKQTLKNAERFITPELKTFEDKILSAGSKAIAREQTLFQQLCDEASKHLKELNTFADTLAALDVLACFARQAVRWQYVQPTIVDEPVMHIEAGRHPVLDQMLGDSFVPNDVTFGKNENTNQDNHQDPVNSLALITGPNMAGKSTYIRQTALIALMAHTGSFVPATSATLGLCDRIFTRVGAHDELHAGKSTFMVEMTETANICHHATPNSLVILDEIGRGTSTLDGLSLAWAIAEHLAGKRCRCLFATHYHELTQLAEQFEQVTNLHVTVREWNEEIVFLHRIAAGATDRSYGIHVAKIAGLPRNVVDRANELLGNLTVDHSAIGTNTASPETAPLPSSQMSLFTEYVAHPVLDDLHKLDINTISPMAAFELLRQMRERLDNTTAADA